MPFISGCFFAFLHTGENLLKKFRIHSCISLSLYLPWSLTSYNVETAAWWSAGQAPHPPTPPPPPPPPPPPCVPRLLRLSYTRTEWYNQCTTSTQILSWCGNIVTIHCCVLHHTSMCPTTHLYVPPPHIPPACHATILYHSGLSQILSHLFHSYFSSNIESYIVIHLLCDNMAPCRYLDFWEF